MSENWIEEAAAHLAAMTDAEDRNRALRQLKMIALNAAPSEAFEPPISTAREYLARPIKVPPQLIYPYVVVRGGITCTIGRAGKGKTVMNLNRMWRWAGGLPMFDGWLDKEKLPLLANPDDLALKILIIENEGAAGMFHRQFGIMGHAEGYLPVAAREKALDNLLIWGEGGYSGLKLDDPEKLRMVREGIKKHRPDIVFIEPFRGLWTGEENSATDMAKVADALSEIASEFDCGVMLSHHERKSGTGEDGEKMSAGRGSTVLEGVVAVMENFESVKGGEQRELSWSKARYEQPPTPCRMEWDPESWWYKYVPTSNVEDAILAELRDDPDGVLNVTDFSERLDEKATALRKVLKKMKDEGRIKALASQSTGKGSTGTRYTLPYGGDVGGGAAI